MKQAVSSVFSHPLIRRYGFPALTVVLFGLLFAFAVFHLLYESRTFTNRIIADDVVRLAQIFERIDAQCKIVSFDYQKNDIDFLTVASFVSSEIGSMNLMLPRKWQGAYVNDNPAVQGRVYQVVRTKKGHFIVPGDGIRLNNGKIIGKDIVLDEDADIEAMTRDPQLLRYKDRPLAKAITLSGIESRPLLDAMVGE